MSLGYEFAPIDVRIEGHPKAWRAGPEAMGLWLWGMVHARAHKTGGRLSRVAVLGAWGGKRNVMLAKRLADCGLWVLRDDGDWDVFNFEEKGPGGRADGEPMTSTERVKAFRKRKRETGETRFGNGSPSVSVSSSVSVSDLSSGSDAGAMPEWFAGSCDAAAMALGGAVDDRPARWAEYASSRDRKTWAKNHGDAVGWLTTVLRSERRSAASRPAARGAEITKQPYDPDAPWLKLPEVG